MQGNIYRLHKDKVEVWKAWATYLDAHVDEVRRTLTEEHIEWEGSFLFAIGDETYVCLYARPMSGKEIVPANTDREINVLHRAKIRECTAERVSTIDHCYLFARADDAAE